MTQRNKTIALALAGSALVGALTVGHAVWAQTGEDPIPLATTASSRPADKLEAQYAVLAGSEQNAESLIAGLRDGKQVLLLATPDSTNPDAASLFALVQTLAEGQMVQRRTTIASGRVELRAVTAPSPLISTVMSPQPWHVAPCSWPSSVINT